MSTLVQLTHVDKLTLTLTHTHWYTHTHTHTNTLIHSQGRGIIKRQSRWLLNFRFFGFWIFFVENWKMQNVFSNKKKQITFCLSFLFIGGGGEIWKKSFIQLLPPLHNYGKATFARIFLKKPAICVSWRERKKKETILLEFFLPSSEVWRNCSWQQSFRLSIWFNLAPIDADTMFKTSLFDWLQLFLIGKRSCKLSYGTTNAIYSWLTPRFFVS